MPDDPGLPFQRELDFAPDSGFDATYAGARRIALDRESWVDHAPGWVRGADALFELLLRTRPWRQRTRWMIQRRVKEPRLTAPWSAASGAPLEPPLLEAIRASLSERYGVVFDSVGFNLYRDGNDGVAWHRDHIRADVERPTIALVSLGERRRLLLRPRGGGASVPFALGRGDLLVAGGRTNHTGSTPCRRSRAPARGSASRSATGWTRARTAAGAGRSARAKEPGPPPAGDGPGLPRSDLRGPGSRAPGRWRARRRRSGTPRRTATPIAA